MWPNVLYHILLKNKSKYLSFWFDALEHVCYYGNTEVKFNVSNCFRSQFLSVKSFMCNAYSRFKHSLSWSLNNFKSLVVLCLSLPFYIFKYIIILSIQSRHLYSTCPGSFSNGHSAHFKCFAFETVARA